jgi:hypothetical protein
MITGGIGAGTWWYLTKVLHPHSGVSAQLSDTKTNRVVQANNSNISTSLYIDSDNDGLYDTIEALYGTEPKKNDTDGDGFTDGDEVRHGYEPLNPAPGKRMVDLALVEVVGKSVASPIVVSSGLSEFDRQRYYLVYDGSSTAYFGADGSLVIQCANDNEQGKCMTLPNQIRTDFSRSFSDGTTADAFHVPF